MVLKFHVAKIKQKFAMDFIAVHVEKSQKILLLRQCWKDGFANVGDFFPHEKNLVVIAPKTFLYHDTQIFNSDFFLLVCSNDIV